MKIKCKNCIPEDGIEKPNFTQSEKQEIWKLKTEKPIFAVKTLIDKYKFSQKEAKYIIAHINSNYGKCNRCSYNNLVEEYKNCPKCKALNFNWKIDK